MSAPISDSTDTTDAQDAKPDEQDVVDTDDTTGVNDSHDDDTWDPERAKSAMSKKNRENESLRRRLKELEARDATLKEIEDKQKSETERLTEGKNKIEGELSKSRLENNRLRLRIDLGLTEEQAARVTGDSYEDMHADAEELLKLFKSADKDAEDEPAPRKKAPAKNLKGGLNPAGGGTDTDTDALVDRIYKNSHLF